jgi:protein-tyrosine phosphatase
MADFTWVYNNLAVGGGIWTPANMKRIASDGITHIIDAQAEFDDTPLAEPYGIKVLWCPTWDDFSTPDPEHFRRACEFVDQTIKVDANAKLLVHCAGGVHRGPMYALLVALHCGRDADEAVRQIMNTRLISSFPDTYRKAVERYIAKAAKQQS